MFKAVQLFKSYILNGDEVCFSGIKTPLTQMTYTTIEHFCLEVPLKDTHYILSKIYLDFLQFLIKSVALFILDVLQWLQLGVVMQIAWEDQKVRRKLFGS